jgi:carboxypeptidase Taq
MSTGASFANDRTAYDSLSARFVRIATIGEASAVLGWDASAMMPPGGGAARGDQLAVLAGLAHGLMTAPETADLLDQAEAAGPDPMRGTPPTCA